MYVSVCQCFNNVIFFQLGMLGTFWIGAVRLIALINCICKWNANGLFFVHLHKLLCFEVTVTK